MVMLFQTNMKRFDCHDLLLEQGTYVLFFGQARGLKADKPPSAAYFPIHIHTHIMHWYYAHNSECTLIGAVAVGTGNIWTHRPSPILVCR